MIAVVRKGQAPISQVAKDFGISKSCLRDWLAKADKADAPVGDNRLTAELWEARMRIRLLEEENEVLRRAATYLARDINPK